MTDLTKFPFLSIIHGVHLMYIRHPPLNTVEYFLDCLDGLEREKRHDILESAYLFVLRPANREKIRELLVPENAEITYSLFREACSGS